MKIAYIVLLVLIATVLAACAGFDVGDVVRVKTPNVIQQQKGLPASTSLNEASSEYKAWHDEVSRVGAQWKSNIERGNEIRTTLNQLALTALDDVGPTLAGIPVLGPALPLLTGLGGLFLGARGLRKEKEKSYNAGIDKATEIVPAGDTFTQE